MAQKLGSEFLRTFTDYEPPVLFGRTKRQLVMTIGTFSSIGLSVLLSVTHFPKWIGYILLGAILVPVFLYGTKKDIELKERYRFSLTIQKRSYRTEQPTKGGEFTHHDFRSHMEITEVDQSRESTQEPAETNPQT
ncbi:PrgI family protein [Streptococcus suis]